jgi:hypothetical protein
MHLSYLSQISRFLKLLESGHGPEALAGGLQVSVMLALVLTLKTIIENQYFHLITKLGIFAKACISCAVYRCAELCTEVFTNSKRLLCLEKL